MDFNSRPDELRSLERRKSKEEAHQPFFLFLLSFSLSLFLSFSVSFLSFSLCFFLFFFSWISPPILSPSHCLSLCGLTHGFHHAMCHPHVLYHVFHLTPSCMSLAMTLGPHYAKRHSAICHMACVIIPCVTRPSSPRKTKKNQFL